jgi:hypothetical protein
METVYVSETLIIYLRIYTASKQNDVILTTVRTSPIVGCPRLLIQYIQLPYIPESLLHPEREDAPSHGDKEYT